MPPTRVPVRPLVLALAGCLAVGWCLGWHPGGDDASAYDAIVTAHTRRAKELGRSRDSLATLATRAETVYVASRRRASALVAELPRVETAGDTIVLTEGRFVAPAPVVALVVRQAHTIQAQESALVAADTTIVALHRVIAADALVAVEQDSVIAAQGHVITAVRHADRWRTVREWGTRALIAGTAYAIGRALP